MQNQNRKINRRDYSGLYLRQRQPALKTIVAEKREIEGIKAPVPVIGTEPSPQVVQRPLETTAKSINFKLFSALTALTLVVAATLWFWPSGAKPAPAAKSPSNPQPAVSQSRNPPAYQAAQTNLSNYSYDAAKNTATFNDVI